MGRYSSSDSEDERRKNKKKKKRRSRSASSGDSYSSSKRMKKSKKIKKKVRKRSRSRSRSRSSEYRRKRSRSRSKRSRSRGRRSRSNSPSRYKSRRTRSRSFSRRKSRSRSRRRSRSKKRSRSRSRSKKIKSRSASVSKDSKNNEVKEEKEDPCASIPGFLGMSAAKQNEIRMKLALKAAAETDARLREQGVLLPDKKTGLEMTYDEEQKRCIAISEIEGDSFTQQTFLSNRNQPRVKEETSTDAHETAMFGDVNALPTTSTKGIVYKNTDSILGPMFYEDVTLKWERWAKHVKEFRGRKLEGEEMAT